MKISAPYNHARYVKIQARNITTFSVAIKLRALRVISRACYLNPKSGDVSYRNLAFHLVAGVNASEGDLKIAETEVATKGVTVDGIKNARPTMCLSTTKNPSWNLTLPANASIYRVSIFGSFPTALRVDVRETMDEAIGQFCGTLQSSDSSVIETSVVCDVRSQQNQPLGLNGYIITIQPTATSDSATIMLCEVEVWGVTPAMQDIVAKKKEDERIASLPPEPDPTDEPTDEPTDDASFSTAPTTEPPAPFPPALSPLAPSPLAPSPPAPSPPTDPPTPDLPVTP
ncbi:hypothetical protein RvY_16436-2 [Ramazzottius varieornatus]|uniref:Uncharacterized protein n=1 Tax=Ramazzottius varieornatus TaxID=947166 RepID=A0A1D1VYH1_RAMVA|nr:hypothetical protein RvY_16436-2 [Ramazzottius varieornatus]